MPSEAAQNCDGEVYNRRTKASMVFRRSMEFRSIVSERVLKQRNCKDVLSRERRC